MKKLVAVMLAFCFVLSLSGCGKEMTLNLSYGIEQVHTLAM